MIAHFHLSVLFAFVLICISTSPTADTCFFDFVIPKHFSDCSTPTRRAPHQARLWQSPPGSALFIPSPVLEGSQLLGDVHLLQSPGVMSHCSSEKLVSGSSLSAATLYRTLSPFPPDYTWGPATFCYNDKSHLSFSFTK